MIDVDLIGNRSEDHIKPINDPCDKVNLRGPKLRQLGEKSLRVDEVSVSERKQKKIKVSRPFDISK